jgi:hypothetical protein
MLFNFAVIFALSFLTIFVLFYLFKRLVQVLAIIPFIKNLVVKRSRHLDLFILVLIILHSILAIIFFTLELAFDFVNDGTASLRPIHTCIITSNINV